MLTHTQSGLRRVENPTATSREILQGIDGQRTWREIFVRARGTLQTAHTKAGNDFISDEKMFSEFEPWFLTLSSIERLLLRKIVI